MQLPQRILIVEDDPTIQLLLRRALEASELHFSDTGLGGLELIESIRPDFVITDINMPEMGGMEMITRARRTFTGACVPILVLTSQQEENVLLESFRRGADDFMVKPFSVSELRMRVSSIYLRQQTARDINPLTRMPGNLVLKHEITARLESSEDLGIAYIDIDGFKGFNDTQGFDAGDQIIELVGDLLRDFASGHESGEVFVGHVGGDDFVALTPLDMVDELAENLFSRFSAATRHYYSEEELAKGTVVIKNRAGEEEEVPLLSLSIGVVNSTRPGVDDLRTVSHIAAEVKKVAKAIPGNSLFVDRRTI